MNNSKDITFYLKWTATVLLIVGSFVNSMGIYPIGVLIMLVGGLCWLTVSILWKEISLIVTNTALSIASISGLIIHYLTA